VVKEDLDRLSALREQLGIRLGPERYELWIGPHTSLQLRDNQLLVGSPSKFQMQWLRRKLHEPLLTCCQQLWDEQFEIHYQVDPHPVDSEPQCTESTSVPAVRASSEKETQGPRGNSCPPDQTVVPAQKKNQPAVRYAMFHSFVTGKGNELAYRTARAVVAQPGRYSPLLLHGSPGVGKSHLLHSIRRQLSGNKPRSPARAIHLTAEQFTAQFLEALDRRSLPGFRQKCRSIDVLLLDDIQFFRGKRATLDELLYTIDSLQDRGHQVVLTSDRTPGELQALSTELVSRIASGLSIPIDPPDYATRMGIAKSLAGRMQIALSDDVIEVIASQVAGSARQLSGAINRLAATSMAWEEPITAEFARQTLVEFVQESAPAVRLTDISRAVCEVFGVEPSSLKSKRKTRSVTEPRMLAMWLARKYTRSALSEIGDFFGRRSHSTVISAQRKIEGLVSQGAEISVADRPCRVEEAIRQVETVLRTA